MLAELLIEIKPVVEARDEQSLVKQTLMVCHKYCEIESAWFLKLAYDGRSFEVIESLERARGNGGDKLVSKKILPAQFSFACDDFSHPFSHVAFSGKGLLLEKLKNNSQMSHKKFVVWVSNSQQKTKLAIQPIIVENKIVGIFAIQSISELIAENSNIEALQQLFAIRWKQLNETKTLHSKQSVLETSLQTLNSNLDATQKRQQLDKSIIGQSSPIDKLKDKIVISARSNLNVLINGETGVGKELVAKAIHELSGRSNESFIALNCAAIPDSLLESELFGYVKGAFSGAHEISVGLLGKSHNGVLFLDEIGDMPLNIQAKLLRVLESRSYRQLGASDERPCDFRLVAATHRNIRVLIKDNLFRSDLYYRLNSFPIVVPHLRDRKEDILELSLNFIKRYNSQYSCDVTGISDTALNQLSSFQFEGNVRELKNIIDLSCAHTENGQSILSIHPCEIEDESFDTELSNDIEKSPLITSFARIDNLKAAVEQFEVSIITERLQLCQGNKTRAAQTLGMPRRTFTHICQRLELSKREY